MVNFTYYGDLLGIGSYYNLSPVVAQLKLREFYTETFNILKSFVERNNKNTVEMFSDSLFVVGTDPFEGFKLLGLLHASLLKKDILLRGAMVKGKLEFEPRVTIKNFSKRLPKDDILAKAAGLEKSHKGARLLIENSLVEMLMTECPEWLTNSGYFRTKNCNPPYYRLLRKISPTPNYQSYEYMHYWTDEIKGCEFQNRKNHLLKIASLQESPGKEHYQATAKLMERCEARYNETNLEFIKKIA